MPILSLATAPMTVSGQVTWDGQSCDWAMNQFSGVCGVAILS